MSSPLLTKLEGEAELMLALHHPNCCSILGVCETPPCLVTGAWVRGLTQPLRPLLGMHLLASAAASPVLCFNKVASQSQPASIVTLLPAHPHRVLRARQRDRVPSGGAHGSGSRGAADLGAPPVDGAGRCKGHDVSCGISEEH